METSPVRVSTNFGTDCRRLRMSAQMRDSRSPAPHALVTTLESLERELHAVDKQSAGPRFAALLHRQFVEIGRSGRWLTRDEVIDEITAAEVRPVVWSQDYAAAIVAPGCALLTYRSAHLLADGTLSRFCLRSSLWQQTASGWVLRFHQGTPTEAFEKADAREPRAPLRPLRRAARSRDA